MELLSKLGIDWSLLLAQIANFAILIGILTFFVYKPLLRLLDERRERIRTSMEEVDRIERQAKEMEKRREEELVKIDREVGSVLERAREQAEEMKRDILASAQKEAQELLAKGRQQLSLERARVFAEVQDTLSTAIVRMTEKILEREFSDADQKRLLESLEKHIPNLVR